MKKLLLLLVICCSIGCHTPPPLTESEVPWRLSPGLYKDTEGQIYIVKNDIPRWSVSEAYLMKSVETAKPETWLSKIQTFYNINSSKLLASLVILFCMWKIFKPR